MVLVMKIILCIVAVSVLQLACSGPFVPPNMKIANEALNEYCKGENISTDIFRSANVYPEKKYDWCVEFITKTNAPQKHVLLLFFKGQQIVKEQRLIE